MAIKRKKKMKEWIESIRELGKRAEKEYEEGDFVDLCIIGRKMSEHLAMLIEDNGIEEDISVIREFFARYIGEEDMFKPYLAQLWGGIPDEDTGKRCMEFIGKIMEIIEKF